MRFNRSTSQKCQVFHHHLRHHHVASPSFQQLQLKNAPKKTSVLENALEDTSQKEDAMFYLGTNSLLRKKAGRILQKKLFGKFVLIWCTTTEAASRASAAAATSSSSSLKFCECIVMWVPAEQELEPSSAPRMCHRSTGV